MVEVPVKWKISMEGADKIKKDMDTISQRFAEGKITYKQWRTEFKEATQAVKVNSAMISYSNRLYRVQHDNLRQASKAVSVFGRAMRSAMSIMNTLNLLTLSQSSATTGIKKGIADLQSDLVAINLELKQIEKDHGTNSIEYQLKLNEKQKVLNDIQDMEKQLEEVTKNEMWTKFVTAGFGIAEGVQTGLALLNNKTLGPKIFKVASSLGKLFGGIFSGFSALIMKAGSWITGALGVGSAVNKSAISAGAMNGTAFGSAFSKAVLVALAIGLGDMLFEQLTGQSVVKKVTGHSPSDVLGIPTPEPEDSFLNTGHNIETGEFSIGQALVFNNKVNDFFEKLGSIFDINTYFPGANAESGNSPYFGPSGSPDLTGMQFPSLSGFAQMFGQEKAIPVTLTNTKDVAEDLREPTLNDFLEISPEEVAINTENTKAIEEDTKTKKEIRKEEKERNNEIARQKKADDDAKRALIEANFADVEATNNLRTEMFAMNTLLAQGFKGSFHFGGGISQGGIGGTDFVATDQNGDGIIEGSDVTGSLHASGFSGVVSQPHAFIAGENGPEMVNIVPFGRGNGTGSPVIVINNHIQGSVVSERELEKLSMNSLKKGLKRAGFG